MCLLHRRFELFGLLAVAAGISPLITGFVVWEISQNVTNDLSWLVCLQWLEARGWKVQDQVLTYWDVAQRVVGPEGQYAFDITATGLAGMVPLLIMKTFVTEN